MSPGEQVALYEKVRKKYPDRSTQWASGYVHGVADEGERAGPASIYCRASDAYALGYRSGFADARGDDIRDKRWVPQGWKIRFEWWRRYR